MNARLLSPIFALLFSSLACSSSDGATPAGSGGAAGSGGLAGAGGAGGAAGSGGLAGAAGSSPACQAKDDKLQSALDGARTSPHAMLAVSDPECGTRTFLSGDPSLASVDDVWRIGSITKTYVSATILELVQDGKLTLDDALDTWVAGLANTSGVTVKMLLNHSSGIFNYTEDPAFLSDLTKKWTPDELATLATQHAPYFAPGADFHYSNTNYVLLGMIAEKASGKTLAAVLHEKALDPAALEHTHLDGEETFSETLAPGYAGNGSDSTYAVDPSGPWAAGAMVASGADMVKWATALYGSDTILDAAQHDLQTSGAISVGGGASYGLGVVILPASVTFGAGPALGHDGAINGYNSQMFYFPDEKLALAAVVNQSGKSANDILAAALDALY